MKKKTSIYLDEELDARLARRAAEDGITKAEFIRRTLAGAVQRPSRARPSLVGLDGTAPAGLSAGLGRHDGNGC